MSWCGCCNWLWMIARLVQYSFLLWHCYCLMWPWPGILQNVAGNCHPADISVYLCSYTVLLVWCGWWCFVQYITVVRGYSCCDVGHTGVANLQGVFVKDFSPYMSLGESVGYKIEKLPTDVGGSSSVVWRVVPDNITTAVLRVSRSCTFFGVFKVVFKSTIV